MYKFFLERKKVKRLKAQNVKEFKRTIHSLKSVIHNYKNSTFANYGNNTTKQDIKTDPEGPGGDISL